MEARSYSAWRVAALLFLGWSIVGLTFAAVSYTAGIIENRAFSLADALRLNLIQFYLWGAFSPLIFWFDRRFTIELRPLQVRRLLAHFGALVLLSAIHQTIHLAIFWSLSPRLRERFPAIIDCYRAYFGFGFYIGLIIALLISIAVHALLYYRNFRAIESQQAATKTQLAQAQLKALKMQIHPHFLFNTLHSISSLVLDDPPKANSMIARLGDFLRLTLDHSDQQLVTLQQEMEFVRCYLEIEQVRFGDRLKVEYLVEPGTTSARVPHLILQPLVENAIQHAIAPRRDRGQITISARQTGDLLELEIRDTGAGPATTIAPGNGHGLGLANVRARLAGLYGSTALFEAGRGSDSGLTVRIRIPFQAEDDGNFDE
ncbi:MAG TPA: histidine kinase [Chthoniobacterales bacterium]|nr:histidine kinase [Chthoniobacterales bacterium]